MNKANQAALAQNVNMTLINIRTTEVNYFKEFYGNFGIQAAVLIGLILTNVGGLAGSNVSGAEEDSTGMTLKAGGKGSPVWAYLFWYGTAIAYILGMHILICTIWCSVFGQGLAIRGPVGSMVQAVEGMIQEQRSIVFFFALCCIFFNISIIGLFGLVLDQINAVMCSIILTLGMYMWYHYALRIYNRFHYEGFFHVNYETTDKEDTLENLARESVHSNDYEKHVKASKTKTSKIKIFKLNSKKPDTDDDDDNNYNNNHDNINDDDDDENGETNGIENPMIKNVIEHTNMMIAPKNPDNMFQAGYLSVKMAKRFTSPWKRRYFVLKGISMFYYKDKNAFVTNPNNPINMRPISLKGYALVAGTMSPPFLITLTPAGEDKRKEWKFRCDTLNEFHQWISRLAEAFKKVNKNDDMMTLQDTGGIAMPQIRSSIRQLDVSDELDISTDA